MSEALPLLRIPPFPRARAFGFASPTADASSPPGNAQLDELVVRERVGGTYWGAQPKLPEPGYILISVRDPHVRRRLLQELPREQRSYCTDRELDCDPWHLVSGASEVIADADDELAMIAGMAGLMVRCVGTGRFGGVETEEGLKELFARHLFGFAYTDPFTGEPMTPRQAVELSGFWRKLIDSNRPISAIYGIASWKRETLEPLMWAGEGRPAFRSDVRCISATNSVAIWRSRTPPRVLADLERQRAEIIEIEDGFIRSAGLGADCIPPSSIIVDRLGIYFEPGRPSDLERILEEGSFAESLLERAKRLRELIVERGVTKYTSGERLPVDRRSTKRVILVPGQVEDDRAVVEGGGPKSNVELLRRVRERAPEAYIIYKPHPDVEAGHRRGSINDNASLAHADEVVRDQPIMSLIDAADEVHVNTSLAGFEALLRSKPVTTYGVPFYAGWGLTADLGAVPSRRTARRSLDELVAAALIVYPRYLDPKTGLPCPPEILIARLAEGVPAGGSSALIWLRRLQGRLRRQLANVANG
jgi:capsular polysaccharide export protein